MVYTGDEKKITINYKINNNGIDNLTSRKFPFEDATAALYFDGKFQWWLEVSGGKGTGLLSTVKPGNHTPAAKTTCLISKGKTLFIE